MKSAAPIFPNGWRFIVLAIFVALAARAPAEESLSDLKARSVKLSLDLLNVGALRECVDVCGKILAQNEMDLDTRALYSRVCWSLGNLVKEKREQKEWFEKGRDAGQTLKEQHPDQPDGYYWHGVNFGEWVDRSSIFAKIGAKKIILDDMNKVLEVNPNYDGGGAYIIVGRINYIAPGGSYSKAVECYEKAIAINPKRTTAYLYLGELYLHEHGMIAPDVHRAVATNPSAPCSACPSPEDRSALF